MTISLYPCGSVITCGPCPECDPLYDYASPPDAFPPVRLVIYMHTGGGELVSGSITYTPAGGGSNVTIPMTLVSAGSKLCIYRDGNYIGPLIYSLGVPPDATLVSVTYTLYYPPSTYDVFTKDIVETCTDGSTQVLRATSTMPLCGTGVAVVAIGVACPTPCTENTGSTSYSARGRSTQAKYAFFSAGVYTCSGGLFSSTITPVSGTTGSVTPSAGNRPCNWTDIAFSIDLVRNKTVTCPDSCGVSSTLSYTVTLAKSAGSNAMTISYSAEANSSTTPSPGPKDKASPLSGSVSATDTIAKIECTLYRFRVSDVSGWSFSHSGSTADFTASIQDYIILEPVP
jgi:hypothetical protein